MVFATKSTLARQMIARALDAGVPCAWVLGDEVYGSDHRLRRLLEQREQPYVLTVRSNEKLWGGAGEEDGRIRRLNWPKPVRPVPGSVCRRVPGARANASTIGHACVWRAGQGRLRRTSCTGCWSGVIAPI